MAFSCIVARLVLWHGSSNKPLESSVPFLVAMSRRTTVRVPRRKPQPGVMSACAPTYPRVRRR